MGFAQLAAMSQCTETDLGGLAAWLSQSTQPELCPTLGFPLKVILPQGWPVYPQKVLSLFGVNFMP